MSAVERGAGRRLYAWLPPILNRAAQHGCLDEDVETGDPVVCEDCYVTPPEATPCSSCTDPAELTTCPLDDGERCTPCHLADCAACQADLADQAAAEARFDGKWC